MTGQSQGAEHSLDTLEGRASYRHFLARGTTMTFNSERGDAAIGPANMRACTIAVIRN